MPHATKLDAALIDIVFERTLATLPASIDATV
jgi:hypothetical protein